MLVDPFYLSDADGYDILHSARLSIVSAPVVKNGRLSGTGSEPRRIMELDFAQITARWVTVHDNAASEEAATMSQSYAKALYLCTWLAQLQREATLQTLDELEQLESTEAEYKTLCDCPDADRTVDNEKRRMVLSLMHRRQRALIRYWREVLEDLWDRLDLEDIPDDVLSVVYADKKPSDRCIAELEKAIKRVVRSCGLTSGQDGIKLGVDDPEIGYDYPEEL
ncbi:hypothetical protein B0H21DRAFT_827095 [Amylocystis lapponica]|nr:hypothetical protein B0H21DRAFT_827095 [Amylocystis lapponica]